MEEEKDILLQPRPDRRLLPNVPDKEGVRTNSDRRGTVDDDIQDRVKKSIEENGTGIRYLVDYPVKVRVGRRFGSVTCTAMDISSSGMALRLEPELEAASAV